MENITCITNRAGMTIDSKSLEINNPFIEINLKEVEHLKSEIVRLEMSIDPRHFDGKNPVTEVLLNKTIKEKYQSEITDLENLGYDITFINPSQCRSK